MDQNPGEVGNVENTPEYTEVEQRALTMGWRPKEEFNGVEDDFIDAKEFVNRKPLFDKIEHQNKQIKAVTKSLDALKQHYTTVQETEFNRALKALKQERRVALQDGDGEKFDVIDDQIKDVEKQLVVVQQNANTPAVQETQEVHPEFQSWVGKNPWYNQGGEMRAFADSYGTTLASQGKTPNEVLKEVETAVRRAFPTKFTNPNKVDAPDVGSSRAPSKGRTDGYVELTEQERRIMNTLVQGGHLTKEKYLADLRVAKGIN
jgi:regulator of replication initiation timing